MKRLLILFAICLTGCSTAFKTTTDPLGKQVVTLSDSTSNALATIGKTINAIPGEIPYATPIKDIALGILSLTTFGLGLAAKVKTTLATQQTAVADSLAATVVKTGQTQAAIATAVNNPSVNTDALKAHLDNNTL